MESWKIKRTVFDSTTLSYLFFVAIIGFVPTDESNLVMRSTYLFILLLIVSAFVSVFLNRLGLKTLGEVIFEPLYKKVLDVKWYHSLWGWELLILFSVTFYLGIHQTELSLQELLDKDGLAGAKRMFQALLSPNVTILPQAIISVIETIFMAFMATILAIPFAFILSFLCAKNIMVTPFFHSIYVILRTILNVCRSVEPLIWATIFSVWVGIGPFAGMLALMIQSVASLAKQYSEIVECVEEGPIEAIQATGANQIQTIWFAIVPQIILPYISFTIYRWDINVRMATVIGLVGGGGIGTLLIQYQGQAMWNEVGCAILVIAIVVWLMDTASAYIREAIK